MEFQEGAFFFGWTDNVFHFDTNLFFQIVSQSIGIFCLLVEHSGIKDLLIFLLCRNSYFGGSLK